MFLARSGWFLLAILTIVGALARSLAPAAELSTAGLVAELRHSFTLDGKQVPPEIFRDFGDGDLHDSGGVWVTVDAKAAIDSDLYSDEIKQNDGWISQEKVATQTSDPEVTDYTYIGMTENGLLVVLASYRGGGAGVFYTLRILDLAPAQAFDLDEKIYDQINLTNVRSVILGDRWDGKVTISKNEITVLTTHGPAQESGGRRTTTIEAKRL